MAAQQFLLTPQDLTSFAAKVGTEVVNAFQATQGGHQYQEAAMNDRAMEEKVEEAAATSWTARVGTTSES